MYNLKSYPEQIVPRLKYGFKDIEIQLHKPLDKKDISTTLDAIHRGARINVVHAAFTKEADASIKQSIIHPEIFSMVEDACRLAKLCASEQSQPVSALIHNGFADSDCIVFSDAVKKATGVIADTARNYPGVPLLIENAAPIMYRDGRTIIREKCSATAQKFVIDEIQNHMVEASAVIDACHAKMVKTYYERSTGETWDTFWKEMFSEYYENDIEVGLFHIADCAGSGLGKDHGISFSESSRSELAHILALRERYFPESEITIEVTEEDYTKEPKNYIKTKNMIDEWKTGRLSFKDKCCLCKRDLYGSGLSVHYIDGAGYLCGKCYKQVYSAKNPEY